MKTLIVPLALLSAGLAFALVPDAHTLFYVSFEDGYAADFSLGPGSAPAPAQAALVPGKVGQAVSLTRGSLTYPAPGNVLKDQGTVELWLRPVWIGTDTRPPALLSLASAAGGYLTLNTVTVDHFGVAIRNHKAEPFVWRRVERRIPDWQPDQWHHAAVTWTATELHLFVDGEEVPGAVTDHAGLEGDVVSLTLGGAGCELDEVRISDLVRSPAEIKQAFDNPGQPGTLRHLSSLTPTKLDPPIGDVVRDAQPAQDEARLPLVIAGQEFSRGIGMYSGQSATWRLDPPVAKLRGAVGLSDLTTGEGPVGVEILGDGKSLFKATVAPNQPAKPLELSLTGVKELTLKSASCPRRQMLVWGQMALLREDVPSLPSAARPIAPERLALARLKRDAGKIGFPLPTSDKGYVLWAKCIEDQQANDQPPTGPLWPRELRLFATPGEYEPVGLLLAAAQDLPSVTLAVTDLKSGAATISATEIDLRLVARQPLRNGYWMKPEPANFSPVPRFAFPYHPFALDAGTMREIYLDVHIPDTAAPGTYRGTLTVQAGTQPTTVALLCRVLPIKLADGPKQYGMYYRMTSMLDAPARLEAELTDMQRHGITVLWPGMGIDITLQDGQPQFSYANLRRMLAALKAHGFHGPIVIEDSLMTLARLMGKKFAVGQPLDETIETDAAYLAEAKRMLDGLLPLQKEFPEFELVLSHMDEVFGRDRLPLFLQFARIANKLSPLRFYITLHTTPTSAWREMFAQAAPLVDIPCFNGHALDDYLKAGGTWPELTQLLAAHKQEAWVYYNIRGSFFTAEWCRLINGLYLWQAPLRVHIPWMYYYASGDIFDDTDAAGHDFAYAAPSRDDPTVLIPTLHYQAMREGGDDARYLYTLKQLIETQKTKRPQEAAAAQKVLDETAALLPRIPEDLQTITHESPWLVALSDKFYGEEYNKIRWRLAEAILKLQGM
jgi:hypothetical protein